MKEQALIKLERKIVIGMIIDTDFLGHISKIIEIKWVLSKEARTLMTWVLDYFNKYKSAPSLKIQEIYEDKLDSGKIQESQAEVIEMVLEDLSEEVQDWDSDDIGYLTDQAEKYCNVCKLRGLSESVEDLLDSGDLKDAQQMAQEYSPIMVLESKAVQPLKTDKQLNDVFTQNQKPLIIYPGALGQVLNPQMQRESFVVYLAQNKGGKSFHLMDAGMRGATQGKKVLMYQAGDMSQVQLERRIAIYITMTSDQERYCGPLYIPIIDCQHNQLGTCEMDCRISDEEGPFEEHGTDFLNEKVTFSDLRQAFHEFSNHKVCQECRRSPKTMFNFKGTVWYRKRPRVSPLQKHNYLQFVKAEEKKFSTPFKALPNLRIATHSNESLNMQTVEHGLHYLKEEEGFEPEILVADYLDLFAPDPDTTHLSLRDQESKKFQRGRRISQDFKLLFLSASQSDADGFHKRLLDKSNFSEDRRKLDHVTGMLGLNMSIQEKMMGIMRINEIVSRETEGTAIVNVLHRLQIGRPILGSYF